MEFQNPVSQLCGPRLDGSSPPCFCFIVYKVSIIIPADDLEHPVLCS